MLTSPMSEVVQYLRSALLPEGADLTDGQPVGQQSVINIPDSERVPVSIKMSLPVCQLR